MCFLLFPKFGIEPASRATDFRATFHATESPRPFPGNGRVLDISQPVSVVGDERCKLQLQQTSGLPNHTTQQCINCRGRLQDASGVEDQEGGSELHRVCEAPFPGDTAAVTVVVAAIG